jgi:hypothetical protein
MPQTAPFTDNIVLENPELYVQSSKGLFFTQRIFWAWIASAAWETIVIFIFASYSLTKGMYVKCFLPSYLALTLIVTLTPIPNPQPIHES